MRQVIQPQPLISVAGAIVSAGDLLAHDAKFGRETPGIALVQMKHKGVVVKPKNRRQEAVWQFEFQNAKWMSERQSKEAPAQNELPANGS